MIRRLTEVEMSVLVLIARGGTNRGIAAELCRSKYTVDTHIRRICDALGAENKAHAVAIAYHVGIFHGATQPTPGRDAA